MFGGVKSRGTDCVGRTPFVLCLIAGLGFSAAAWGAGRLEAYFVKITGNDTASCRADAVVSVGDTGTTFTNVTSLSVNGCPEFVSLSYWFKKPNVDSGYWTMTSPIHVPNLDTVKLYVFAQNNVSQLEPFHPVLSLMEKGGAATTCDTLTDSLYILWIKPQNVNAKKGHLIFTADTAGGFPFREVKSGRVLFLSAAGGDTLLDTVLPLGKRTWCILGSKCQLDIEAGTNDGKPAIGGTWRFGASCQSRFEFRHELVPSTKGALGIQNIFAHEHYPLSFEQDTLKFVGTGQKYSPTHIGPQFCVDSGHYVLTAYVDPSEDSLPTSEGVVKHLSIPVRVDRAVSRQLSLYYPDSSTLSSFAAAVLAKNLFDTTASCTYSHDASNHLMRVYVSTSFSTDYAISVTLPDTLGVASLYAFDGSDSSAWSQDYGYVLNQGVSDHNIVAVRVPHATDSLHVVYEHISETPGGIGNADTQRPAPDLSISVEPASFATKARIRFSLPRRQAVTLAVYDAAGKLVQMLANSILPAGYHVLDWQPSPDVPAGVYYCRVSSERQRATAKATLIR